MTKKVTFGKKPTEKKTIINVEEWIEKGSSETPVAATPEKIETVRFTIDIPVELHAKIKYKCAIKKVKMKQEIQALLERHFK